MRWETLSKEFLATSSLWQKRLERFAHVSWKSTSSLTIEPSRLPDERHLRGPLSNLGSWDSPSHKQGSNFFYVLPLSSYWRFPSSTTSESQSNSRYRSYPSAASCNRISWMILYHSARSVLSKSSLNLRGAACPKSRLLSLAYIVILTMPQRTMFNSGTDPSLYS